MHYTEVRVHGALALANAGGDRRVRAPLSFVL
jgi:hypothetical protein